MVQKCFNGEIYMERRRCSCCGRYVKRGLYPTLQHAEICPNKQKGQRKISDNFNTLKPREINFMMSSANYWMLQQVLNEYLLETLLDETVL